MAHWTDINIKLPEEELTASGIGSRKSIEVLLLIESEKSRFRRVGYWDYKASCWLQNNQQLRPEQLFGSVISWSRILDMPVENLILPKDGSKISFVDLERNKFDGTYVRSEELFFKGFEETGDFLHKCDVKSWTSYVEF